MTQAAFNRALIVAALLILILFGIIIGHLMPQDPSTACFPGPQHPLCYSLQDDQ